MLSNLASSSIEYMLHTTFDSNEVVLVRYLRGLKSEAWKK